MPLYNIASNIGLIAFAGASVLYLQSFQQPTGGRGAAQPLVAGSAFTLFIVATLAASVGVTLSFAQGHFFEGPGLLLAATLGWLTIFANLRFRVRPIGAFLAPLATLLLLLHFFTTPVANVPTAHGFGILGAFHVVMAIIGEAFAIVACAFAVIYLLQQSALKRKRLDQLPVNVPALDRMERLLLNSLWAGFVFLTLGLISGALYSKWYVAVSDRGLAIKIAWAIAVWLWYLAMLLAKNAFNRTGKLVAKMSLVGFVLLALAYFGMFSIGHI